MSRMSRGADPNAPTKLDINARRELLLEPELVTMREECEKLMQQAAGVELDV